MGFQIIWSQFAETQLDGVFEYYKLIYSIDEENGFIKIADVFDTRQNPPKIKRTK